MWNELSTDEELQNFMVTINYFHDSCIKEINYISGAYVNSDLAMHPVNDIRSLRVVIQRQYSDYLTIELEFKELHYLSLRPTSDLYTCEILHATLFKKNDLIYWSDCEMDFSKLANFKSKATMICASRLRWRSIDEEERF